MNSFTDLQRFRQLKLRLRVGVGLLLVALVAFIVSFSSITYKVDEGERGIKVRWGQVEGVGTPGLNFKLPFIDSIYYESVQPQTINLPNIPTYSKDQQPAQISLSVTFGLSREPKHLEQFYGDFRTIKNMFERVIKPVVLQEFKVVFGQYTATSAIQERDRLIKDSHRAITNQLKPYPYLVINNIQIEDIDFSDAYEKTVEERMRAEVEVQKVQQELHREKIQADILTTQAKAKADAITLQAQAEAKALEIKGKALKDNPLLLELSRIERWDGVMPKVQGGNALPILDLGQTAAQSPQATPAPTETKTE